MSHSVTDNAVRQRYELVVDGLTAFADYRREDGRLVIAYVEAPPRLRGTGAAGRLMQGVLDQARGDGLKVVPLCSYARAYMQRHAEYADLMA